MQRDGRTCHELTKVNCHLFDTDLPGRTMLLLFRVLEGCKRLNRQQCTTHGKPDASPLELPGSRFEHLTVTKDEGEQYGVGDDILCGARAPVNTQLREAPSCRYFTEHLLVIVQPR